MVSKETQVQTLIPTIVVFWSYVDFYMLYVDCMLAIQVLYLGCMFKKYELYIYVYISTQNGYILCGWWMEMHSGMLSKNA